MTLLESLPQPVPTGIDYYALRAQDYMARHPAESPPDYYLHYGDKYCRRFCCWKDQLPRQPPGGPFQQDDIPDSL